ncbi:DNA gyrase subunit B [Agreia bicolorata]|uniref:DNA gyrase subunit B n=1 Tax=Agreia bicolorata TaxID=110935 RepID=A0A1T4Y3D9_9MICO|nr:DNA gyrase subunit B [Agreia bicolorata]
MGDVGCPQLMHMVLEIVAYADDEAADQQRIGRVLIEVTDSEISVADDGRGTDTRRDADGVAVRKPIMATQDIRFFGREDSPVLPDGEPRRGMSAVAASCEQLIHENRRHDGAWSQTYERGVPVADLVEVKQWSGSGTTVRLRQLDRRVVAGLDLAELGSLLSGFRNLDVIVQSR